MRNCCAALGIGTAIGAVLIVAAFLSLPLWPESWLQALIDPE